MAHCGDLESSVVSERVEEGFQQPDLGAGGGVHGRGAVPLTVTAREVDGWQEGQYEGVHRVLLEAVDAGGTSNVLQELLCLQGRVNRNRIW